MRRAHPQFQGWMITEKKNTKVELMGTWFVFSLKAQPVSLVWHINV